MEEPRVDESDVAATGGIPDVLAITEAYRDAVNQLSELYVLDEVARSKLIVLVTKIARKRMQSANYLADRSDIETIAILAVRHFLQLRSGATL